MENEIGNHMENDMETGSMYGGTEIERTRLHRIGCGGRYVQLGLHEEYRRRTLASTQASKLCQSAPTPLLVLLVPVLFLDREGCPGLYSVT